MSILTSTLPRHILEEALLPSLPPDSFKCVGDVVESNVSDGVLR